VCDPVSTIIELKPAAGDACKACCLTCPWLLDRFYGQSAPNKAIAYRYVQRALKLGGCGITVPETVSVIRPSPFHLRHSDVEYPKMKESSEILRQIRLRQGRLARHAASKA
jgi:hypothetical protein